MFSIIFADEYEAATRLIAEWRQNAGLTQRELGVRLSRSQGHIHRMETRQRPIDLIEFCRIAQVTGVPPVEGLRQLPTAWEVSGVTLPAAVCEAAVLLGDASRRDQHAAS